MIERVKRALIIVDYQRDLADPKGLFYTPGNDLIKNQIEFLKTEFKATDDLVVGVQIKLTEEMAKELSVKWKRSRMGFIAASWGQEYALNPNDFDLMITKSKQLLAGETSAFKSCDAKGSILDNFLKQYEIKQVTIVGIATEIGVSSTASDAFRLGYEVEIDLDACAGENNIIKLV